MTTTAILEHRAAARRPGVLPTGTLASWLRELKELDTCVDDAGLVDQLRLLEELKAAAAAAQVRVAVRLDAAQRSAQAAAGIPAHAQGAGVAAQVALARRESPVRGAQHLGLAKALVAEMPHTLAALEDGRLTEWRAQLLARETACLSLEHRAAVDRRIAGDAEALEQLGDRALANAARRLAAELDAASVVRRSAKAESERRVTIRPAPDTMAHVTGLLPVAQGVAVYAALAAEADRRRATGDARSRGQIMADTLVSRVTGQASATGTPVEVQVVISDRSLLGDAAPAHLQGFGPIPAALGRRLVREADRAWLRRCFTDPRTGELAAMDSKRRVFPPPIRRAIEVRDQSCRTPWCDAPIRHRDHVTPHHEGGPTSLDNAQGLCEACNYAKQSPGWRAQARVDFRGHHVTTTTPTGHSYASRPPPLPGSERQPRHHESALEQRFREILDAA